MTATKPERPFVRVTDDTTADDPRELLGLLCDNAKRLSRRGYVGTHCEAYTREHARIDAVLAELDAMCGSS